MGLFSRDDKPNDAEPTKPCPKCQKLMIEERPWNNVTAGFFGHITPTVAGGDYQPERHWWCGCGHKEVEKLPSDNQIRWERVNNPANTTVRL